MLLAKIFFGVELLGLVPFIAAKLAKADLILIPSIKSIHKFGLTCGKSEILLVHCVKLQLVALLGKLINTWEVACAKFVILVGLGCNSVLSFEGLLARKLEDMVLHL